MSMHYEIAGPDIVHESFGGDLVVLNLASGQYFGLNSTGAALWTAVVSGRSLADIADTDEALAVVRSFADELVSLGLIIKGRGQSAASGEPIDTTERPVIEVYDDLSDLIVADPIHDVDEERGWPKMPDTA